MALAPQRGVGLDGEDAAHDIRELRNLLDAFNEAKRTAGITLVKMIVTGLVLALLAGTVLKIKVVRRWAMIETAGGLGGVFRLAPEILKWLDRKG